METLLPPTFVDIPVTAADMKIASITWGFTLGFGFLTTWTACKQTMDVNRRYGVSRLNSPYIWMIWLEILVCLIFAIICWLHLNGNIPASFAFYFVILTLWALQVQFLLQIIINRVSILLTDRRKATQMKVSVAVLITAINISVYCIWIPARLQISAEYEHINNIWDRCEKVIYLLVDGILNWYFIHIVNERLVRQGLTKYKRLVRFNMWIIGLSLSMDVLIIGMMSLPNSFVYMQFHPLAYIVKLKIEMSMADLIAKVSSTTQERNHPSTQSRSRDPHHITSDPPHKAGQPEPDRHERSKKISSYPPSDISSDIELSDINRRPGEIEVNMKREVTVQIERRMSVNDSTKESSEAGGHGNGVAMVEDDTRPLKEEDRERERVGMQKGMGIYTKAWGPDDDEFRFGK